jgi:hypothetical protein
MRLILVTAYFIVILLLPDFVYPSSEWLVISSAGDEINYIDSESILYNGPVAFYWTKNVDRKGEITKTSYYTNCEAGTGAIKEIIIYDSEEAVAKSYYFQDDKLQWAKITPQSFLHAFRNVVCVTK